MSKRNGAKSCSRRTRRLDLLHRFPESNCGSGGLLGYAWPKCVHSGERSGFRVHSPGAFKLSLWYYGWEKTLVRPIGWFDEHGPRATVQITPDQDYTQTGVQ